LPDEAQARSVNIRGVVQGVGFRPFVFRLAHANALSGWVLNGEDGVEIHVEGPESRVDTFVRALLVNPPPAASIVSIDVRPSVSAGIQGFEIRRSELRSRPAARISPDMPICELCLRELFDPTDPRFAYPYINCMDCGPRYSILLGLPYDRSNTTMQHWAMDKQCSSQYEDPSDRRFHAQPLACPHCGPHYSLESPDGRLDDGRSAVERAAQLLAAGGIVAIKGLGGYHLACSATDARAVQLLRERKFRKEKPFAVMARNLETAHLLIDLSPAAEELLLSTPRPIVLAPARRELHAVAPGTNELGVMLPYTPLHHLLFQAGAPAALVMTSANRSSEPIAYQDEDARARLTGIADAFVVGQRSIARRVDDSVACAGAFGPVILRRARGYAPGVVSTIPIRTPVLALGADLKNTIALAVEGEVILSQHIGDLEHYSAFEALTEAVADLMRMYDVRWEQTLIVHDRHPQYVSTRYASQLPGMRRIGVQHHRAHIASAVAEREAWDKHVLGVAFDGTGYEDDGTICGGEIFTGSVRQGFLRAAQLRRASLLGGDAAARHPVQAAAGFLAQLNSLPDLRTAPFRFPQRYRDSTQLLRSGVRTFTTTSMGRLFDAAAALTGFTRPVTFEGQAAMWLEHLARRSGPVDPYPFPLQGIELDFRPLLMAVVRDRLQGRDPAAVARAFHLGIAHGLAHALQTLSRAHNLDTAVLSGGVFQNRLLLEDLGDLLANTALTVWTNNTVPPNDGGICLGQVALAVFEVAPHA
jgi:hydrogenase maturation protein HypF